MAELKHIRVRGARVHNLKNIDVDIPRNELVVLTGLSGSGKSSLAFDTIYAEGQRRYVESLSSYARQFLQMQDKPDVDLIEGLSPAISIEQKTTSKNPRSTVATVTEIYDYLRLLYARIGKVFCYSCKKPIVGRTATQIVDQIMIYPEGSKLSILSPLVRERKGEHKKLLETLQKDGFARVKVDGEVRMLDEEIYLALRKKHSIDVYIDRVVVKAEARARIADAVELSLKMSEGLVRIVHHQKGEDDSEELISDKHACLDCGISYPELEPRMFSFNAPQGACKPCSGLGKIQEIEEDLVIPDGTLSLSKGAIKPWGGLWTGYYMSMLRGVANEYGFSLETPWQKLSAEHKKLILFGTKKKIKMVMANKSKSSSHAMNKKFEGVIPNLNRRYKETQSNRVRWDLERYMAKSACKTCGGTRLRQESRHVKVGDLAINDLVKLSISESLDFIKDLDLNKRDSFIGEAILKEIEARLNFLNSVGLNYLSLDRSSGTLSGGEAQRIRLASQIGSALMGVLYVLDEPSIGLHQRDNQKLLETLKHLRDIGNTVLVVEHDEDTMMAADYLIDLGPGAGHLGGEVVFSGRPKDILECEESLTGQYMSRKKVIEIPKERRKGMGECLELMGATGNNLQNISVKFPLGQLICVTGVSGSGKSTLILDTLHKALDQALYNARERPLSFKDIIGLEHVDKVVEINQSPIGRTPRSNPVTYTGVFDEIRKIFTKVPEAQVRGYGPGRFSFNVKGGRCESCQGDGVNKIEMNFLPDVYVQCDECKGKRYNPETLQILYKTKHISDVLAMTVAEGLEFFKAIPQIKRRLQTLFDVGLSYIHLGQPANTLSGGEAQRIKLSKELSKRSTGKTLYILDEPTTGLHFHDVAQLLQILHRLADQGNTVLVIEHNLDVIKTADHIIDIGPEGGSGGGKVLIAGTPEAVAKSKKSYTGLFLKELFKRDGHDIKKKRQAVKESVPDQLNKIRGRRAKKERIQKS